MTNRIIRRTLPLIWLVLWAVACQSSGSGTLPVPTVQPTNSPVERPVQIPTLIVQPSPTFTAESALATPIQSAATFTLTILHTGQVYGEITPCG